MTTVNLALLSPRGANNNLNLGGVLEVVFDAGVYSVTGSAANIYPLQHPVAGSLSINFTSVYHNVSFTAGSGEYGVVGTTEVFAGLFEPAVLTASGSAAALLYGRAITTGQGAYSSTGVAATTMIVPTLSTPIGRYNIDVKPQGYVPRVSTRRASYDKRYAHAAMYHSRALIGESREFGLSGKPIGIELCRRMTANPYDMTITGSAAQ